MSDDVGASSDNGWQFRGPVAAFERWYKYDQTARIERLEADVKRLQRENEELRCKLRQARMWKAQEMVDRYGR